MKTSTILFLAGLAQFVPTSLADVAAIYTPMDSYSVGEDISLTWHESVSDAGPVSIRAVNRESGAVTDLGTAHSNDLSLNVLWGANLGDGTFYLVLTQTSPAKVLFSGDFKVFPNDDETSVEESIAVASRELRKLLPKLFGRGLIGDVAGAVVPLAEAAIANPAAPVSPVGAVVAPAVPVVAPAVPVVAPAVPVVAPAVPVVAPAVPVVAPAVPVVATSASAGLPTRPNEAITIATPAAEPAPVEPAPIAPVAAATTIPLAAPLAQEIPTPTPTLTTPVGAVSGSNIANQLQAQVMSMAEVSAISIINTYLDVPQTIPTALTLAATTISIPTAANHFTFSYPATETEWTASTGRAIPINGMFDGKARTRREASAAPADSQAPSTLALALAIVPVILALY